MLNPLAWNRIIAINYQLISKPVIEFHKCSVFRVWFQFKWYCKNVWYCLYPFSLGYSRNHEAKNRNHWYTSIILTSFVSVWAGKSKERKLAINRLVPKWEPNYRLTVFTDCSQRFQTLMGSKSIPPLTERLFFKRSGHPYLVQHRDRILTNQDTKAYKVPLPASKWTCLTTAHNFIVILDRNVGVN